VIGLTGAKQAWQALGNVNNGRKSGEESNVKFRRSLYFVRDLKAGEIIATEHVKSIRLGYGLAPKYLDNVIGKFVVVDVKAGSPVSIDVISQ
jgi:N-acetylneuraminate synthase